MLPSPWSGLGPAPILLDAALGTALLARGLPDGTPPELWNVDRPDAVLDVHRAHARAGARVLRTNTFGAHEGVLAAARRRDDLDRIVESAVRLARRAAEEIDRPVRVAGALGPSRLPADDRGAARASWTAAARRMAAAGVDELALETMTSREEARLALTAALATERPVSVGLTIGPAARLRLPDGSPALETAAELAEAGAFAVGFQCSFGPEGMAEAVRRLRERLPAAVATFLKPNSGPERSAEAFAAELGPALGASLGAVGGCCGTGTAHLRALADRIRKI